MATIVPTSNILRYIQYHDDIIVIIAGVGSDSDSKLHLKFKCAVTDEVSLNSGWIDLCACKLASWLPD